MNFVFSVATLLLIKEIIVLCDRHRRPRVYFVFHAEPKISIESQGMVIYSSPSKTQNDKLQVNHTAAPLAVRHQEILLV